MKNGHNIIYFFASNPQTRRFYLFYPKHRDLKCFGLYFQFVCLFNPDSVQKCRQDILPFVAVIVTVLLRHPQTPDCVTRKRSIATHANARLRRSQKTEKPSERNNPSRRLREMFLTNGFLSEK
jgi:hypothetical protein